MCQGILQTDQTFIISLLVIFIVGNDIILFLLFLYTNTVVEQSVSFKLYLGHDDHYSLTNKESRRMSVLSGFCGPAAALSWLALWKTVLEFQNMKDYNGWQ